MVILLSVPLRYITQSDMEYNLEGFDLQDYPFTDEINAEGYLFSSHINKLRKGEKTIDYLSSKYLHITDTRRVLEISKAIMENNIIENEANHQLVDPKDVLSDNVLHYDRDTKSLETIPSEMVRDTKDQERVC